MQTLTGNAASAIALRNAIFKVIPKALVDRVYEKAKHYAVGEQKDLSVRRKIIFEKFGQWNIEPKQILKFFQRNSIDEFTQADLEKLIGMGTSIKEGHIAAEEAFLLKEEPTQIININERINSLLEKEENKHHENA